MLPLLIVLGLIVVVVAWLVGIYNSLVGLKHAVSQAWANIDVLLKQRHDELPKLVETCKQYMKHERETLEAVMRARAAVAAAREAVSRYGTGACGSPLDASDAVDAHAPSASRSPRRSSSGSPPQSPPTSSCWPKKASRAC